MTPNEGPDTDRPQNLPALQTDVQPLRYLDFLIHDSISAVMLHKSGVLVLVPAPERFAVHKLILALERPPAVTKRDKDVSQAEALIITLLDRRSDELRLVWEEAYGRGPKWRRLLLGGMTHLSSEARDLLLRALQQPRKILPGIKLTFSERPPQYIADRQIVSFVGEALGHPVRFAVSREALDDHFGSDGQGNEGRLASFHRNRSKIERMVKTKYLSLPVEEPDTVLLTTTEVEKLSAVTQGPDTGP